MPSTPIKEELTMQVESLVETIRDVASIPMDDPIYPGGHEHVGIPAGTVGIVLQRPNTDKPRQFLISFVGNRQYWMYHNEISPYFGEKK